MKNKPRKKASASNKYEPYIKAKNKIKELNEEVADLKRQVTRLNRYIDDADQSERSTREKLSRLLHENQMQACRISGCEPFVYAVNLFKIYQSQHAPAENPFIEEKKWNE